MLDLGQTLLSSHQIDDSPYKVRIWLRQVWCNIFFLHIFRCCHIINGLECRGLGHGLPSCSRAKKWTTTSRKWMAWIYYTTPLEKNSCWNNWFFHSICFKIGGHVYCSWLVQSNWCWQVLIYLLISSLLTAWSRKKMSIKTLNYVCTVEPLFKGSLGRRQTVA